LEAGRDSRRGKVLCITVKCCWGQNILMGVEEMGKWNDSSKGRIWKLRKRIE